MGQLSNKPIAILVLTASGMDLAQRVKDVLANAGSQALVYGRSAGDSTDQTFSDTKSTLQQLFRDGTPIVALCASGIVIRALSSLLDDKFNEPPVLTISRDGVSVVPLLGGHHGANELASLLATGLQGHAAITTAGDCQFRLALDTPPTGWALQHPERAKSIMARLLDGETATIASELDWLSNSRVPQSVSSTIAIKSSILREEDHSDQLTFSPQKLVVGVGCERGLDGSHLIELIQKVIDDNNLAPESVACLASIDLKADEEAMHQAARHFGVPVRFHTAEGLEAETPRLANPSDVVFNEVGCHGVAEGAALASVGTDGSLLVPKVKTDKATCAIGLAASPLDPNLVGQARGHLSVIGIGPGQAEWRTPEATRLVAEAEELVGYGLYIDLLGSLADGKKRTDFPLGGEEDRCRYALEEAAKGKKVALICSGDAGIYAMGALVMELMDRDEQNGGVSDLAKRVEIINAPGISALQAASARFGAILGHDFCTISLSDLLTPWEAIEKRLHAATEGDFVIAFYNPVSKRRRMQLAEAKRILLEHRPSDTPVLLCSNLGRPTENLRLRHLESLEVDEVDMLTVVLVGSSQSKSFQTGDISVGDLGQRVYTPRGYAKHIDATDR